MTAIKLNDGDMIFLALLVIALYKLMCPTMSTLTTQIHETNLVLGRCFEGAGRSSTPKSIIKLCKTFSDGS
jgi:hypothetical protein